MNKGEKICEIISQLCFDNVNNFIWPNYLLIDVASFLYLQKYVLSLNDKNAFTSVKSNDLSYEDFPDLDKEAIDTLNDCDISEIKIDSINFGFGLVKCIVLGQTNTFIKILSDSQTNIDKAISIGEE